MKKAIVFVLALILLSVISNAGQDPSGNFMKLKKPRAQESGCFDDKTHLISAGVGFGGYGIFVRGLGGGYVYSSSPMFSVSYEQAYPKKLGPGYLGVGALLGYRTAHSRYSDYYYLGERYYYEHRWNYITIATRGVYHWDFLNRKNAEVYAGVIAGLKITTYSYSSNSSDPYVSSNRRSDGGVSPVVGVFAGARWYFVPNISLYGELGAGASIISGGITFKF